MKNLQEITEMTARMENANTATVEGRLEVVNACKRLYNLIEEDVFMAGSEWMLPGMYKDLCSGNFAEPFMCEQKKMTFLTTVKIYQDRILPRL